MTTANTPRRLTLTHVAGVLLGRRASIETAAGDPATLWVGALFVAVAALAREYDGEDLRREPFHLAIPFAASVVLALALYALVRFRRRSLDPFWRGYRAFLGLFWLTAPMAMLYAVPYERLLGPADAVRANLWTLALVSLWRALVTVRVVQIMTGRSLVASFILAAFVANAFAGIGFYLVPYPVLQMMGGIRLTEVDQLLQSVGLLGQLITLAAFPLLGIAAMVVTARGEPECSPDEPERSPLDVGELQRASANHPYRRGPFVAGGVCLIAFLALLPRTQPAQRLRSDADRRLRSGELQSAVAEMSRHDRSDYPPLWDPLPRLGWPEPEVPAVLDVLEVIAQHDAAPWVRAEYIDKLERRSLASRALRYDLDEWPAIDRIIDRLPEGPALRVKYADVLAEARHLHAQGLNATTDPSTAPSGEH